MIETASIGIAGSCRGEALRRPEHLPAFIYDLALFHRGSFPLSAML